MRMNFITALGLHAIPGFKRSLNKGRSNIEKTKPGEMTRYLGDIDRKEEMTHV
jgi:hypothetical protein